MAQNIVLQGATYSAVPSVNLPKQGGGTASFVDVTDTTAAAADVASGKYFYTSAGVRTAGTNSGGGGGTDFVITLTYDSQDEIWKPDCTFAQVSAAYSAEKTISAKTDEFNCATDIWIESYDPDPLAFVCEVVWFDENEEKTAIDSYYWEAQDGWYLDGRGYTFVPFLETTTRTYTPSTTAQTDTITPSQDYDGIEEVSITVNAIPSGTAGTPTASKGSVSNHAVTVTPSVTNTTGYITGGTKTGTGVSVSASELVSGTYNVTSSGTKDVTNYASASVPSGTAGTPTATKGTVSNHSVSVTPSVTNTTGFITGSTKTGTAVTVSASELVSGSQTITSNQTVDVTNLAEVVVNVSGGGSSKNAQVVQQSSTRITSTAYSKACGDITVSKTGTYDVYWAAYRTSTSGTWGTQLYIGNSAYGNAQTTFSSYYQTVHLSNVSLTANQSISVYGRSRGSNYYLYVGQLTIIEA